MQAELTCRLQKSTPETVILKYDLITNTPNSTSAPEPETAGFIAWLLYQAYLATYSIPICKGMGIYGSINA
ncbi:MAG: hypothetical protein LBG17_03665 [Bacteroidales bacterium]|jgi:hypothetical protein|nr:hypothetical protein [Bacteroidales bacterium]